MSTSTSEQESFSKGQSDGAKGTYEPPVGFIDTILNRPYRDCDNDVRDRAYERGHAQGSANRK